MGRLLGVRVVLLLGVAALGTLVLLARGWRHRDIVSGEPVPQPEKVRLELEQKLRALNRRNLGKHRVVRAVLAGQVTLQEAAAYFRALDREGPPVRWDLIRAHWPGSSDDERYCHQVIWWAYWEGAESNELHAAAVRDNLLAELDEHLCRGPLRLPDLNRLSPSIDHD
jgi:hypothetical protein